MDKATFDKKKAEIVRKQQNTNLIFASAGLVGGIAGVVYAVKTKRSFWGGVGFFILGSLVVGVPTRIGMIARTNKLQQDAESLDAEYGSGTTNKNTSSKNMATSNQFDILASKATDIFEGLSSDKLSTLKNNFMKNFTSSDADKFISLINKGEKNWTASEKIDANTLLQRLISKKIVS